MTNDIFGNAIEETHEEEIISKPKKLTPFDFIKSVSETKKDLMEENTSAESEYNSYIVNRGLGYFPDTILFANEMNLHSNIPGKLQYYYYLAGIRKRKRYSKWHKLDKNDDLEMIQRIYNVRVEVAKEYLKLLSETDLQTLRDLVDTGETKPNK